MQMQNILVLIVVLSGSLVMSACTAHKIEIQQGNVVTEKQLGMLKVGMEPRQVLFIMGSPLLRDPFHPDQWDYFYRLEQRGEQQSQYRVTLFFQGERLTRIEKSKDIPATEQQALELVLDEEPRRD